LVQQKVEEIAKSTCENNWRWQQKKMKR